MNITFLKLYITDELNSSFYNSQEIGLAKAVTEVYPEHRVNIVLLSRSESKVEQITDKVKLYVVKAKGIGHHGMLGGAALVGNGDAGGVATGLDILKALNTDLLHLLADNMLYAPNVIRYCRKNGIKYQLYIGTLFTDSNKWYRKALDRLMMARNIAEYKKSPVYVKTPFVQEQCKELGIEAKLAPVGLNPEDVELSERTVEEIRAQYGIPTGKKVLLFVGRLEEYKHPLDAIEVFGSLQKWQADNNLDNGVNGINPTDKCTVGYHLVVVGRGSLEDSMKTMISGLGLVESVTFLSKVPNTEMKHLYKACDYYVNFNPDEIYGMSILEAMAHRCLVFAIHAPGPDFLIENGVTGFLCSSVEEMTLKICRCEAEDEAVCKMTAKVDGLSCGEKSEAILEAARQQILDKFIWDKLVKRFEDFN